MEDPVEPNMTLNFKSEPSSEETVKLHARGSTGAAKSSDGPSPVTPVDAGFSDEIEDLKRKLLELELRQTQSNRAKTTEPALDPDAVAEIERYKRMEACLYKHRKEWEMNVGPGSWRVGDDSSRHFDIGGTSWNTWFRGVTSQHQYERPDIFDPAHQCDASSTNGPYSTREEDNYDMAIVWGHRRDRLRKNFEWEMDRLLLGEEFHNKQLEQKKDAAEKKRRERRMAETSTHLEKEQKEASMSTDQENEDLKVIWSEWSSFKFSSGMDGKKAPVVNVLFGEPVIDDDVGTSQFWFAASRRRQLKKDLAPPPVNTSLSSFDPTTSPVPERIRVSSDALLRILVTLLGSNAKPLLGMEEMRAVFLRPYKALVYREQALREWCKALEKKFKKSVPSSKATAVPNSELIVDISGASDMVNETGIVVEDKMPEQDSSKSSGLPTFESVTDEMIDNKFGISTVYNQTVESENEDEAYEGEDSSNDLTRSLTALNHLQYLLKFLDTSISPKRNYLNSNQCRKVFFSDLWYVFRPGVEVIGSDGKQAYKIIGVTTSKHRVASRWERWYNPPSDGHAAPRRPDLSLTCVYIDFDGANIGPVKKTFNFYRFDGQREITSLKVYPLSFHSSTRAEYRHVEWAEVETLPAPERYRKELIQRGAKFLDVAGGKHMYYAGSTLDAKDEVESPVVVDFETTFTMHDKPDEQTDKPGLLSPPVRNDETETSKDSTNQIWKPKLSTLIGTESDPAPNEDIVCNGECCRDEFVHDDQYVDLKLKADYIDHLLPKAGAVEKQPPITILPRPMSLLKTESLESPVCSDDELVIMSYRVFGFVLRSRKFAKLDLAYLSEIHKKQKQNTEGTAQKKDSFQQRKKQPEPTLAFNRLVLEKGHHSMIVSLIAQHFRDKRSKTGQREEFDIVKGKGKGLIILLHGAPGVGKTSTAEGVAELFQKPLFQITCGDLGTTATEVETALEKNFSLANKWDCILLLDEADVFLAERTKEDFKRNGLVAVFLRLMEYYSGILFLTTNRVGDFDEAFTSRIHVSLYYPELNEDKTVRVFELNMDMIEDRFETKGRVIKIDRLKIGSFAARYFAENKYARWNGRQIRNACQTALALAEFEAQDKSLDDTEDPNIVVNLKVEHFEVVRNAYLEFTKYINDLHGTNSARRAKEARLRAIWIDENDRVVKTQNMEGTRLDKKNAFFLASQNQPSGPPRHLPQQSSPQQPLQEYGRYQHQRSNSGVHQPQYQNAPQQDNHYSGHQDWDSRSASNLAAFAPEPQHEEHFQGSTSHRHQVTPSPIPQQYSQPNMPSFNENIRDMYAASGQRRDDQATSGASGSTVPFDPYNREYH